MPHPKKLYHPVSATPYPLFPEPYLPAQVCDSRRSFGLNDNPLLPSARETCSPYRESARPQQLVSPNLNNYRGSACARCSLRLHCFP